MKRFLSIALAAGWLPPLALQAQIAEVTEAAAQGRPVAAIPPQAAELGADAPEIAAQRLVSPTLDSPVLSPGLMAGAVIGAAAGTGRMAGIPPVSGQTLVGSLPGPAAPAGPSAGRPRAKGPALPQLDFTAFSPERLRDAPAAGIHAAGRELMDQALGIKAQSGRGDASGVFKPARRDARGLAPASQKSEDGASALKKAKHEIEPGVYSAHRLGVFERDPEGYALTYIFGVEDPAPKGYELLVGLSVHRALETIFGWLKSGRPGRGITWEEVRAEYEKAWDEELASGSWKPKDGWTPSDFKNRGLMYLERRFQELYPFDKQGRVVYVEEELRWTIEDPATHKAYPFKGKIDRLMVQGDTVYIRDWKTHSNPPSLEQLKRDDYQLGLYALALKRSRPDLVAGKKIKLAWDFKEFSQELDADDAYLAGVQDRVLSVLHAMETFTQRVEAERADWLKRLSPAKNPAGLKAAREQVDELAGVQELLRGKRTELGGLRRRYEEAQDGLAAFVGARGLREIQGKSARAVVERGEKRGLLPTKAEDPQAHEEMSRLLKEAGIWEKFSSLSASALRAMAEVQGHPDHAVFDRLKSLLRSSHADELEVEENEAAAESSKRGGGVAPARVRREARASEEAEPGLYSPHQLKVFAADPKEYALRYLLRVRDASPKTMDILAGLAVHETLEEVFTWLKGGQPGGDIQLASALKLYGEKWAELLGDGSWKPEAGLTPAEYERRGELYLRAKWKDLYPFSGQGRVVYLEKRMHFTVADEETGKVYKFQGIPDRVMLDGDAIVIRDWKTHWVPPTDQEIRENDFQLGLYALALRQLFPDLMRGRKVRLVWDFKDKTTVIEADDAYLAGVKAKVVGLLRGVEKLKAEVERDHGKWEALARPAAAPKNPAEAALQVDALAALSASIDAADAEVKRLAARSAALEAQLIAFSRSTGLVRIAGAKATAALRKKGMVAVPTKTKDGRDYERVVAVLKEAGAWERYSQLDLPALKKAMADPNRPDRAALARLDPYLRSVRTVKVTLVDDGGGGKD